MIFIISLFRRTPLLSELLFEEVYWKSIIQVEDCEIKLTTSWIIRHFFIRYSFRRETVYIYSIEVSIAIQKMCSLNSPCFRIKTHLRCPHWAASLQTVLPFTKWAIYFMKKNYIFLLVHFTIFFFHGYERCANLSSSKQ